MEHHYGLNPDSYTFKRSPIELVFHEQYNDINLAIRTEKRIQKWSGKKKAALAKGDWDKIKELAECRNNSHSKYLGLDSARPDNRGEARSDKVKGARPDNRGVMRPENTKEAGHDSGREVRYDKRRKAGKKKRKRKSKKFLSLGL